MASSLSSTRPRHRQQATPSSLLTHPFHSVPYTTPMQAPSPFSLALFSPASCSLDAAPSSPPLPLPDAEQEIQWEEEPVEDEPVKDSDGRRAQDDAHLLDAEENKWTRPAASRHSRPQPRRRGPGSGSCDASSSDSEWRQSEESGSEGDSNDSCSSIDSLAEEEKEKQKEKLRAERKQRSAQRAEEARLRQQEKQDHSSRVRSDLGLPSSSEKPVVASASAPPFRRSRAHPALAKRKLSALLPASQPVSLPRPAREETQPAIVHSVWTPQQAANSQQQQQLRLHAAIVIPSGQITMSAPMRSPPLPPPYLLPSPAASTSPALLSGPQLLMLPVDSLHLVLSWLHPLDLLRYGSVSQACRLQLLDAAVWRPLVEQSWPISCSHQHDWRRVYIARIKRALAGSLHFCTHCDCTKAFTVARCLPEHQRRHHSGSEPTQHRCPQADCGRFYTTAGQLRQHALLHAEGRRKFACDWAGCGKSFHTPYSLRLHRCRHTGEKRPHPCRQQGCDRSFNDRRALRLHMQRHHEADGAKEGKEQGGGCVRQQEAEHGRGGSDTSVRSWRCGAAGCDRSYASEGGLSHHVSRVHCSKEEAERWRCDGCKLAFRFRSYLNKHSKVCKRDDVTVKQAEQQE